MGTDDLGRVRFPDLGPAAYDLVVGPRFKPILRRRVELTADQPTVDLRLTPESARTVVIHAVDTEGMIWITAGEVFLEESYNVSPGVEAYAITGFFYKVREGILQTTQCFQAVYTRKPDNRPEWFSFPLKLRVSH